MVPSPSSESTCTASTVRRQSGIGSILAGRNAAARLRGISRAMVAAFLALAWAAGGCSHSEARVEASHPEPPALSYIGEWGTKGDGPGQLDEPTCIAADAVGKAYVADAGSHFVHKFDTDGTPLLSFQENALKNPQSITVDSGGAIYVTELTSSSAFVFFPNGDKYHQLKLKSRANDEDMLSVAVDDGGVIQILDAEADRVFTYTPRFRLTKSWIPDAGESDARLHPRAVAAAPDGSVYLLDADAGRVLKFTSDGHFLSAMKTNGGSGRLSDAFAVSAAGIFAMDVDGRTLHAWSVDGQAKLDMDLAPQLGQGTRATPELAVSPRKELLVLDVPESRVLRYRINF
jgi:streptogramin lyase